MFNSVVDRVNQALASCQANTRKSMRRVAAGREDEEEYVDQQSIGVLDIYGFEIFETNSFEQFCINYVNEKLQQIFIELTLRSEQEEYESEGIAWTKIPFFDNKVVCDLIENKRPKPGVFPLLDDTCKTMHSKGGAETDGTFVDSLDRVQGNHPHFTKTRTGFTIKHYAGDVTYTVQGFCNANKDTLFQDLQVLAQSSTNDFARSLYPEPVDYDNRKSPSTAGYKIKSQCGQLVSTLMDCTPHYVRCIKSNDLKKAGVFDLDRVTHQVRYLGLLENVKVRRAGFAYRVDFFRFIRRFKVIAHEVWDHQLLTTGTDLEMATAILDAARQYLPELQDPAEAQLGRTKVFIKQPETYFALQHLRKAKVADMVSMIQSTYRWEGELHL